MTRVRLILAAVAILIAVPVVMLVHRAIASAAAEEWARRQALADTAFSAVERELAALSGREGSRAWDEWRHLRVPEGEVAGSVGLVRSPLADLPAESWNLGWFQVDPGGAVGTPLLPDAALAATLSLPPASIAVRERDAEVRALVGDWLAARRARPVTPARPPARAGPGRRQEQELEADLEAAPPPRVESRKGMADAVLDLRRNEQAAPRKVEVFQKQSRAETVQQVLRNAAPEESGRGPTGEEGRDSPPGDGARAALADDALTGGKASPVDVIVEPFAGELDAGGRLVLHRLVVVGGETYRQGLVLDVGRLAEAVSPLELLARTADASGRFALRAGAGPTRRDGAFDQRLPPPFDALTATLSLHVRASLDGARAVRGLAALVALVGLAGLLAVDRMVATALGYARRRSDFVSAVTHELKTPLAAIRLHGELLREGVARTEEKRAASYRTITAECERLTRLVDNVLELSRLEKGTRSVSLAAGPVEPVLREAVGILEPHARSAGFALEVDVEPGLAACFDRDALVQVVVNLVDNALKYARAAEVRTVTLGGRREGDAAVLLVRDRGPGVPPRHLRRIFEPFWRGERELTRETKGTGIGLALVRGLVQRMHGRVTGANPAGGGLEVRVELPAAKKGSDPFSQRKGV